MEQIKISVGVPLSVGAHFHVGERPVSTALLKALPDLVRVVLKIKLRGVIMDESSLASSVLGIVFLLLPLTAGGMTILF